MDWVPDGFNEAILVGEMMEDMNLVQNWHVIVKLFDFKTFGSQFRTGVFRFSPWFRLNKRILKSVSVSAKMNKVEKQTEICFLALLKDLKYIRNLTKKWLSNMENSKKGVIEI